MQFFQVCTYLMSKSWETRIAAGQAVEAIARNVKKWQPAGISSGSSRQPSPGGVAGPAAETEPTATSKEPSPTSDKDADLLTFETFDLNQVISVVYIMKCCIAENFAGQIFHQALLPLQYLVEFLLPMQYGSLYPIIINIGQKNPQIICQVAKNVVKVPLYMVQVFFMCVCVSPCAQ